VILNQQVKTMEPVAAASAPGPTTAPAASKTASQKPGTK